MQVVTCRPPPQGANKLVPVGTYSTDGTPHHDMLLIQLGAPTRQPTGMQGEATREAPCNRLHPADGACHRSHTGDCKVRDLPPQTPPPPQKKKREREGGRREENFCSVREP